MGAVRCRVFCQLQVWLYCTGPRKSADTGLTLVGLLSSILPSILAATHPAAPQAGRLPEVRRAGDAPSRSGGAAARAVGQAAIPRAIEAARHGQRDGAAACCALRLPQVGREDGHRGLKVPADVVGARLSGSSSSSSRGGASSVMSANLPGDARDQYGHGCPNHTAGTVAEHVHPPVQLSCTGGA